MRNGLDRRSFLKLAGLGGAVLVTGVGRSASAAEETFFFVQLSDTHWGFQGPVVNPDPRGTLPKAIAAVNALPLEPDFVIFTGDLTHTTDDPGERRKRLTEFREQASALKNPNVRYMAGEHDASLDRGEAWKEFFGKTYYTFDHKGVHFICIDNVSDPAARIGDVQLDWLRDDLARQDKDARIVVFTHRPLFDLVPQWDWATRDGARAIDLLMPFRHVTAFYGHIHQEHHHATAHIEHHSAQSLIFPLPAPGSQPTREPIRWDAAQPYRGLGYREVAAKNPPPAYAITEFPVQKA